MKYFILILDLVVLTKCDPFHVMKLPEKNETSPSLLNTRRILNGRPVGATRPYMVYLRAGPDVEAKIIETDWLCGGVIIHERFILTSAACIEDAKNFYVVSGTDKWVPVTDVNNECIKYGAKRAVWKCVPKSYFFDGDEFDNIHWMVGDIAVVKVESAFNFGKRVRGCDYIPVKVAYNNDSFDLEKAGTFGTVIGWGSTERFVDVDKVPLRNALNSYDLLETDVVLISKKSCRDRWEERYHFIINEHMLCTKDYTRDDQNMNFECAVNDMKCKGLVTYNDEEEYYIEDEDGRRGMTDPRDFVVHTAAHRSPTRRSRQRLPISGGFCENDHGGPLVVGQGRSAKVIGIMSACLTERLTNKCHGPFLFTSVIKYRNLIACAINRNLGPTCRKLLDGSQNQVVETLLVWPKEPLRKQPDYPMEMQLRKGIPIGADYIDEPNLPPAEIKIPPPHNYRARIPQPRRPDYNNYQPRPNQQLRTQDYQYQSNYEQYNGRAADFNRPETNILHKMVEGPPNDVTDQELYDKRAKSEEMPQRQFIQHDPQNSEIMAHQSTSGLQNKYSEIKDVIMRRFINRNYMKT